MMAPSGEQRHLSAKIHFLHLRGREKERFSLFKKQKKKEKNRSRRTLPVQVIEPLRESPDRESHMESHMPGMPVYMGRPATGDVR